MGRDYVWLPVMVLKTSPEAHDLIAGPACLNVIMVPL
jgi:hypothetical protein